MTLTIDIHIIQSVPPANLNRDDSGSPKTAFYGGVQRSRVSSQAWKRATRQQFKTLLDPSQVGVRTLRAVELLAARISSLDPTLPAAESGSRASKVLNAAGFKVVDKRRKAKTDGEDESLQEVKTEYLVFFSSNQLDGLAALAADGDFTAASAKAVMKSGNGIDLSLFGRMVANDADLNVDASVQVSHAISTHAVTPEFDFYTAVDDENPENETGAGMMGTIEFNSATLYRYASLNVDLLAQQLGDKADALSAVGAFVEAFATSMPTGKVNTFANNTLPDAVIVMLREGRGVSLVGAFEQPVTSDGGFIEPSARRLVEYSREVTKAFAAAPVRTWVVRVGQETSSLDQIGERVALPELVSALRELVAGRVS